MRWIAASRGFGVSAFWWLLFSLNEMRIELLEPLCRMKCGEKPDACAAGLPHHPAWFKSPVAAALAGFAVSDSRVTTSGIQGRFRAGEANSTELVCMRHQS